MLDPFHRNIIFLRYLFQNLLPITGYSCFFSASRRPIFVPPLPYSLSIVIYLKSIFRSFLVNAARFASDATSCRPGHAAYAGMSALFSADTRIPLRSFLVNAARFASDATSCRPRHAAYAGMSVPFFSGHSNSASLLSRERSPLRFRRHFVPSQTCRLRRHVRAAFKLAVVQVGIESFFRKKFFVCSALNHISVFQHQDQIRVFDRGETMGDHK